MMPNVSTLDRRLVEHERASPLRLTGSSAITKVPVASTSSAGLTTVPSPSSVLTMTRTSFFSSGFCAQLALTGSKQRAEREGAQGPPQTDEPGGRTTHDHGQSPS